MNHQRWTPGHHRHETLLNIFAKSLGPPSGASLPYPPSNFFFNENLRLPTQHPRFGTTTTKHTKNTHSRPEREITWLGSTPKPQDSIVHHQNDITFFFWKPQSLKLPFAPIESWVRSNSWQLFRRKNMGKTPFLSEFSPQNPSGKMLDSQQLVPILKKPRSFFFIFPGKITSRPTRIFDPWFLIHIFYGVKVIFNRLRTWKSPFCQREI